MGRDVAKIAEALSRPRIDPRKFVDLAVVTAVAVDGDGVHCDVVTSDGQPETAALVTPYGGPGYGLYAPIDLDDAVLLAVPDGVFNLGARVIGRVWDPASPPPQEALDHQEDLVVVVKPGQSLRIVVAGGGNVVLKVQDSGKIQAGGDDADDPVLRLSDLKAYHQNVYAPHTHAVPGPATSGPPSTAAASLPSGSSVTFTK